MKSEIKDLQCPCGCELAVPHKLEVLYGHLRKHGFNVTGLVSCEQKRQGVAVKHACVVDAQSKILANVYCDVPFTALWNAEQHAWHVHVDTTKGVLYG